MKTTPPFNLAASPPGEQPGKRDIRRWRLVKLQVLLGFALLIILIIVTGTITIQQIAMLGRLTSTIHEQSLEVSNAALRASMSVAKIRRSMRDIILTDEETAREAILKHLETEEAGVYRDLDLIRDKILEAEGRELGEKCRAEFEKWKPIRQQVTMLILAGRVNEATRLTLGKGAEQVEIIQTSLLELTSYTKDKADLFITHADNLQKKTKRFMLAFILAGILLSCAIALITLNRLYYAIKRYRLFQEENERLIVELKQALTEVRKLSGFLPICASCKKIRDDKGYWNQIESYIRDHSEAQFSHSLCPECSEKLYGEFTKKSGK
ncbi:MAG TPA: MCP four helix bundle domain-containing protein [Deltaproteobacteria bacterium]|nr:MCP four helix bundle domain-containing protein [Deltaproteobacteria bacterium]